MVGKDGGKLKTFSFSRIERLLVAATTFEPDPGIEQTLVDDDGIWLGEERKEIVLQVSEQLMLPHQQGVYAERAVS